MPSVFADGFENLIECQIPLPRLAFARVVATTGLAEAQEPRQPVRAEFALQHLKCVPIEFFVRHCSRSDFAKYNSTRSVVQVATPQPKKSVSSVQIGQPSARAATPAARCTCAGTTPRVPRKNG